MPTDNLRTIASSLPRDARLHVVGEGDAHSPPLSTFLDGVAQRAPVDGKDLRGVFERDAVLLFIKDNKPANTIGVLFGTSYVLYSSVAFVEWQRHTAIFRPADLSAIQRKKPLFGLGPLTLTFSVAKDVRPRVPDGVDLASQFFGFFDELSLEDIAKAHRDAFATFVDACDDLPLPTGLLR